MANDKQQNILLDLFPTMENAAENISLLEQIGIPVEDFKGVFTGETECFSGDCTEPGKPQNKVLCSVLVSIQRDSKGCMTVFLDDMRWDRYFRKFHSNPEPKTKEELEKENAELRRELERVIESEKIKDSIIEELEALQVLKGENNEK